MSGLIRIILSILILLVAGCSSAPTQHYLLTPINQHQSFKNQRALFIGVGPIELPGYLDRIAIATRVLPHELNVSDFHRWAEPLSDNINSVILNNLKSILKTPQVIQYPWENEQRIDYRVIIDFERFDCDWPTQCVLEATWKITNKSNSKLYHAEHDRFIEPVTEANYHGMVTSLNQLVNQLSREIATRISRLHAK